MSCSPSFNDASHGTSLAVPSVPRALAVATIVLSVIVTVLQAVGCVLAFGVTSAMQELNYWDELPSVFATYDQITVAKLVAQIAAGVVAILWLWQSRATRRHAFDRLAWWWTWLLIFAFASNAAAQVVSVETIGVLPTFEVIAMIALFFALIGWIDIIRMLTAVQGKRVLDYRAGRTPHSVGGVGGLGRL